MILRNIILDLVYKLFIYFTILCVFALYLRSTTPEFSIEILKRDFEKTLKRFFQKSSRLFTRTHQNLEYFLGYKSLKILSIVKKFGNVFAVNNFNL